jgi:hypothetical protein
MRFPYAADWALSSLGGLEPQRGKVVLDLR